MGTDARNKVTDDALTQLEETQDALRKSIEESKQLAAESERLVKRHRRELDEGR